jgi:cytochrome c
MKTSFAGALLLGLAIGATAPAQAQADPLALMEKAGCLACHQKDKKVVGPSLTTIAAKYKGQDASAMLVQKVRNGGKGVYGPIPMPATGPDKMSDADLKAAIDWIVKL